MQGPLPPAPSPACGGAGRVRGRTSAPATDTVAGAYFITPAPCPRANPW